MSKLLTVSIAAYNVQEYLHKTLDSLLIHERNKMDELEVIIVNDGSYDNTIEIAKAYERRYPKIFKIIDKKNGGYGSTINAALKEAHGKYFKLLDGDDWLETDNLSQFIDTLKRTEVDLVLSPYIECYGENGERIRKEQPYEYNIQFETSALLKYSMHAMCIRTACIKGKITITENCYYTDSEFFIKSAMNCTSCIYISLPIYCYRVGREDQSMDINNLVKHYDDYFYVACYMVKILKKNPKIEGMKKSIYSLLATSFGYSLLLSQEDGAKEKFLMCRECIKESWEDVAPLLTNSQKIVFRFPWMYGTINRYQRRKKKITV